MDVTDVEEETCSSLGALREAVLLLRQEGGSLAVGDAEEYGVHWEYVSVSDQLVSAGLMALEGALARGLNLCWLRICQEEDDDGGAYFSVNFCLSTTVLSDDHSAWRPPAHGWFNAQLVAVSAYARARDDDSEWSPVKRRLIYRAPVPKEGS